MCKRVKLHLRDCMVWLTAAPALCRTCTHVYCAERETHAKRKPFKGNTSPGTPHQRVNYTISSAEKHYQVLALTTGTMNPESG